MTLIRRLVSSLVLEAPFTRQGPIRCDQWEGDATQWFWKCSIGHDDDCYDDDNPILGGLMRRWAADAKTKTTSPFDAKYWQTTGGNQDAETATLTRGYAPTLLAFFHEKYRVNKSHHGSFEFQVVWDAVCNVDPQRTSTGDGFGTSEQLIRDTGPLIGRAAANVVISCVVRLSPSLSAARLSLSLLLPLPPLLPRYVWRKPGRWPLRS
jgi:hypothetical protein